MENITFKHIASFLKCGREVEFAYNGRQYSITNRNSKWYLCCDTDNSILSELCEYQDLDILVSKVSNYTLQNVTIAEIFDNLLYQADSVYIM